NEQENGMPHETSPLPTIGQRRRRMPAVAGILATITMSAGLLVSCSSIDAAVPEPERKVTPDVVALAGPLADQELVWETCEFNDDGLPIPGADVSNVECATIKVP